MPESTEKLEVVAKIIASLDQSRVKEIKIDWENMETYESYDACPKICITMTDNSPDGYDSCSSSDSSESSESSESSYQ